MLACHRFPKVLAKRSCRSRVAEAFAVFMGPDQVLAGLLCGCARPLLGTDPTEDSVGSGLTDREQL